MWDLEENGGSIVGGAIKLIRERKANPPPPRDPKLPPKPSGQTVASFKSGIQMLPQAVEAAISDKIRSGTSYHASLKPCILLSRLCVQPISTFPFHIAPAAAFSTYIFVSTPLIDSSSPSTFQSPFRARAAWYPSPPPTPPPTPTPTHPPPHPLFPSTSPSTIPRSLN